MIILGFIKDSKTAKSTLELADPDVQDIVDGCSTVFTFILSRSTESSVPLEVRFEQTTILWLLSLVQVS